MKRAGDVGNEVDRTTVVVRIGPTAVAVAIGQVVRSGFAFRLAFVLEPYCDGFYFPIRVRNQNSASATFGNGRDASSYGGRRGSKKYELVKRTFHLLRQRPRGLLGKGVNSGGRGSRAS